jgi:hypothetical protein
VNETGFSYLPAKCNVGQSRSVRYNFIFLIRHGSLLLFVLLWSNSTLRAQNGLALNLSWAFGPYGGHAFKIATTAANGNAGSYDHLHLIATTNPNDYAGNGNSIDALFANRGGFVAQYTMRGSTSDSMVRLQAYQQSDGTVGIYIVFASGYVVGGYTVLENVEEEVYTSPTDIGEATPPGTLIFDTGNPAVYPPATHLDFSGRFGIGVNGPQAALHVASQNVALSSNGGPFGNGNIVVQGTGQRSTAAGPAISFVPAANLDGSNPWEAARIIATPDNNLDAHAEGRLSLQTRFLNSSFWDWRNNLVLTSNGYVGVGTTTPTSVLHVNGNVTISGTSSSITFPDNSVQSTAWNGILHGGDYAESVDVVGERARYEPGDVMVVDPAFRGKFSKSVSSYSTAVIGIYSSKPGIVGRRQTTPETHMSEEVPMAMIGIVPTKVSAEGGAIKPGDLLVTSSLPGYAMKGTDRSQLAGAIVGKALGSLDTGTGLIEVAVSLQ